MSDGNAVRHWSKRRYTLIALGAVAVIALLVVLASYTRIDAQLVQQQLDRFAAHLKQEGQAQGRDVELTYGEVEITGRLSDRHAIVHDPKLLIKPLPGNAPPPSAGKPGSLLLSTPTFEIYPESADLSAMRLVLPSAINVATEETPGKALLTIAPATPWTLDVTQERTDSRDYVHYHHDWPKSTKLTYLREHPGAADTYETIILSLDSGEGDLRIAIGEKKLGESTVLLKDIVIAPEGMPDAAIKIAEFDSKWSDTLDSKGIETMTSSLHFGDITAAAELLPNAPISLVYDFIYNGGDAKTAKSSHFVLKTLALHTKNAALDATADFSGEANDVLPVGKAHLSLTNLPFLTAELKKYGMLSAEGEALVADIVSHIAGMDFADVKDLSVDVARTHGGAFVIGHSTFEELFTIFLRHKLSHVQPQPAVPAAPAKGDDHGSSH
ncbi:MAG: hypothetical protein WDN72_05525 [Alphaproteobacteria bacterium]